MCYSLYHSNPLIDLCTTSMCSDQDMVWFVTTPNFLNESDLSIAVEFTLSEMSLTSLSSCEGPKISKFYLEIVRVNRLLKNHFNWKL